VSGILAVIIVALVFSGLAGGIWWGATRGNLGNLSNAVLSQSRTGRRMFGVVMVVIYVGFGIAVPLVFIYGNRDRASAQVGGIKLTAAEKQGRILFGEHCAVCHTLSAAAAVGKVGPDLDQLRPPYVIVIHTIEYGCLQNPGNDLNEACLDYGNMPADVVEGRDAQDVARFVAAVAGH
jgi:hypothetical protein